MDKFKSSLSIYLQIAQLIPMADEFVNEEFCTGLFDEFLFAGLTRDNVTRHMLKLLWYTHTKLPAGRLATLMKALEPNAQHTESVHTLYRNLQERIGIAIQESAAHEIVDMDFDSPLKSVPTPGPHYMQ